MVFHNRSNYDYRFIIKEFAKEFRKQFTCLGENTQKDKNFIVPIVKEELIEMEKKLQKISYIKQFVDSAKLMASPLSNLVNNLYEGIQRIQC